MLFKIIIVQQRSTRSSISGCITSNFQRLNIPLFKTPTGQKTFYCRSVSIWNKLDPSLDQIMQESCFLQVSFKTPSE